MKRSPFSATTGFASTSCATVDAPGAMPASFGMEMRAGTSAVARCRCSGVQCSSGSFSEASTVTRASMRCVGAWIASASSQSPRATVSRSVPVRFNAQRCPACARSAGLPRIWMPRTRTGVPLGETTSLSLTATAPLNTVPVTTVPLPAMVKARSMA